MMKLHFVVFIAGSHEVHRKVSAILHGFSTKDTLLLPGFLLGMPLLLTWHFRQGPLAADTARPMTIGRRRACGF